MSVRSTNASAFQHTAARRRLHWEIIWRRKAARFQHTAARRRLRARLGASHEQSRFNTQPPEGGWLSGSLHPAVPAVSTHSRPKAAAVSRSAAPAAACFNTQPPEGGCFSCFGRGFRQPVSTHSRPKAAGIRGASTAPTFRFNTQPPEGGWPNPCPTSAVGLFQHTAARRRLGIAADTVTEPGVSTHSRPKAAEYWYAPTLPATLFQHTAARRRLSIGTRPRCPPRCFNTQPPEGG